jgi:hypothetical protein
MQVYRKRRTRHLSSASFKSITQECLGHYLVIKLNSHLGCKSRHKAFVDQCCSTAHTLISQGINTIDTRHSLHIVCLEKRRKNLNWWLNKATYLRLVTLQQDLAVFLVQVREASLVGWYPILKFIKVMLVFLLLVDTAGQVRCSLKEEKASFEGDMIYVIGQEPMTS